MIHPHYGTRIVRSRTCAFWNLPDISIVTSRWYYVTFFLRFRYTVIVWRTLRFFLIENTVWVNTKWKPCIIFEYNFYGISNFGVYHRSQYPKMLPLVLDWL